MSPDDPTILPGLLEKHHRSTFDIEQERRTSALTAPKERIEDHKGEVLTCAFDPTGELVLSGGRDCFLRLCRVYTEGGYVMVMSGHTGPILEASFSANGSHFYTGSGDKTIGNWDTYRGLRIDQLKGHTAYVNSVQGFQNAPFLCSGSDDGTIRIWDTRAKACTTKLKVGYRVFGTCFNDTGNSVICAGANNSINIWDIRKKEITCRLRGHMAPVTGIALSPCGAFLLSQSLDSTLRTWDIRPTSIPNGRCINLFPSYHDYSQRNLTRCGWSQVGNKVAAGCADGQQVNVWDLKRRTLFCRVPVHKDAVNDIAFHPYEPIILTASSDKFVCLTEVEH